MNKSFDSETEPSVSAASGRGSTVDVADQLLAALRRLVLQCMDFSDQRIIAGQRLSTYQMNSQKIADLVIQLAVVQVACERLTATAASRAETEEVIENICFAAMLILELATEVMSGSLYVDGTPATGSYRECLALIDQMQRYWCEDHR